MLDAGQKFAHFTIVRKLGEGGMGAVYLAEDQKLHRQVALKTLTAEYFDDVEGGERFQREARTAAQINHPNIMAIYDFGSDKDSHGREMSYIVMEYIKGQSLSAVMKDGKLDMPQTLRLAEKIAAGLAAAHKLGIVHRDIKPENIFVDENGEPKVLDFGLAKPVNPVQMEGGNATNTVSQELTKVGKILGTVSYMSPEQVRGEAVDQRSDVFAFGILLYRMATGTLPFSGTTQVSTLAKILEAAHEPPHVKNENIPAELERIIDKCLQKDPNDRYQDTRDLVVDLRNLRKQVDSGVTETVSTMAVQPKKEKKKFQLSWKWVALLGCAIPIGAITLISLVAILINGFSSDEEKAAKVRLAEQIAGKYTSGHGGATAAGESIVAILSFDNKANDTTLNWLETGLPEILATDLSQHHSMEIINPSRLQDFVAKQGAEKSRDAYVDAAQTLGASMLLSGSYFKMGKNIRIDARLEDLSSGKIMLAEKVVGADPFTLVDSLTHKMSSSLNVADVASGETSADILTSSPEAYKHYIVGLDYFLDEKFDESIREFEQSIKLDSNFALPYMRIGMANAFQQRNQQGAKYFGLAKRHEAKLPIRERNLLDVYADLWLNQKFQDAFTKMTALASNYPDDKEILTVDGLLIWAFNRDTTAAFKMFDSSLSIDPGFQLSLGQKSSIYEQMGNYDAAVKLIEQIKKYHPESAAAYSSLGRLYRRMQRYDEAAAAYQEFDRRFPSISDGLWGLQRLAVLRRDFDEADRQLDQLGRRFKDNSFEMYEYWGAKVSLAQWRGQFRTALEYGQKQLEVARQTKDSSFVYSAYSAIGSQYYNYDMMDSALVYVTKAYDWAPVFSKMSYPIQVVARKRSEAERVRPMLEKSVDIFKSRIPPNLWPIGDGIKEVFEGYAAADTQRVINGLKSLANLQKDGNDQNLAELGLTQIKFGQYAEGKAQLEAFVSGPKETSSGFSYPYYMYLLGIANEGLGDKHAAADCYRQMLGYWSKPQIELTEIKDAKERLARLSS